MLSFPSVLSLRSQCYSVLRPGLDAAGEFCPAITAHNQLLGEQQQQQCLVELNSNLHLLVKTVTARTAPGVSAPLAPTSTFRAPVQAMHLCLRDFCYDVPYILPVTEVCPTWKRLHGS